MTRPLIGVTGRRKPARELGTALSKALRGTEVDLHVVDYVRSVALAGGVPVQLTRDAGVADVVAHLDGIVFSGGADIEPSRYGQDPDPLLQATEPTRDEWEFALYEAARAKGIPVLGICRGLQLINVAHGGTLNQNVDIDEGSGHPQWELDGATKSHTVSCVVDTAVAELYQVAGEMGVNSLHHQTVDQLGADLIVGAYAPDGVVEAIATPDNNVLALQWHPELLDKPDPAFVWLVERASR